MHMALGGARGGLSRSPIDDAVSHGAGASSRAQERLISQFSQWRTVSQLPSAK